MTLKLKRTPGLYLVGFMASGKTEVGRVLAEELGWKFFDMDTEIQKREGCTIAEVFASRGEQHFREVESTTLQHLVSRIQGGHPCVVATGGGAFGEQRNWDIVENNGVTVWLDCSLEVIENRLGSHDPARPLSVNRQLMRELYEARRPLYARADFHIDANCNEPSQVTRRILDLPIF